MARFADPKLIYPSLHKLTCFFIAYVDSRYVQLGGDKIRNE